MLIHFTGNTSLGNELQEAYEQVRAELIEAIGEICWDEGLNAEQASKRLALEVRLATLPEDPDEGWIRWLEAEDDTARTAFGPIINDWLAAKPRWNEMDSRPDWATAQGAAYRYFMNEPGDVLDRVGVVIVEGDCPGSNYFATELEVSIKEANAAYKAIGSPIRFTAG